MPEAVPASARYLGTSLCTDGPQGLRFRVSPTRRRGRLSAEQGHDAESGKAISTAEEEELQSSTKVRFGSSAFHVPSNFSST